MLDQVHNQFLSKLVDAYGPDQAMRTLARMAGYREHPPTIQEFLSNDDYGGLFVGSRLRTCWRDLLYETFPNPFYSPYFELIISGAIGTGKSVASSLGICYDLCRVLCLDKPQDFFNLIPSTVIDFALISVTKTQVKSIDFDQIMAWIEGSAFFKSIITKNKKRRVTDPLFHNRINIALASRAAQTAGHAIISAFYDEANEGIIKNQASELYSSILRRIESRFIQREGMLPSHFWLVSSKKDESAWLQMHTDEQRTNPKTKIYEIPIWEAKKDDNIYNGQTFRVFAGDRVHDPFIVHSDHDLLGLDDALILDVPVEYQTSFRLDLIQSLRDIAGVGTWSSQKFLPFGELIEEAQTRENPFHRVELSLDLFDNNDTIIKYMKIDEITPPEAVCFVHIDIGLTRDRTGICCIHQDGWVRATRYDKQKQLYITVKEPVYYVDWIVCAKGRSGQQFPITKVRLFLEELKKRGWRFAIISADGYQSKNLLQDLTIYSGFETEEVSVDRHREPYDNLKNVITESRLNCVRHPILDEELRNLLDMGKKIDHPEGDMYGKDVADALCGSIYSCYIHQDDLSIQTTPEEYYGEMAGYAEVAYKPTSLVETFWSPNSPIDKKFYFDR